MLDQEVGTAQLNARHPLICEEGGKHVTMQATQPINYVGTIAAVSCAGIVSER